MLEKFELVSHEFHYSPWETFPSQRNNESHFLGAIHHKLSVRKGCRGELLTVQFIVPQLRFYRVQLPEPTSRKGTQFGACWLSEKRCHSLQKEQ